MLLSPKVLQKKSFLEDKMFQTAQVSVAAGLMKILGSIGMVY
jgi:hypothetical protein